jgi:uncharacterized protein (TIGR03086 family)
VTDRDWRPQHRRAITLATERVETLGSDDLTRPTPCVGWRLADLLAHMIGQHHGFTQAVRSGGAPAEAYAPVPFDQHVWRECVDGLVDAFATADLDQPVLLIELGTAPVTIRYAVAAQLLDTVVHNWDIARAVGLDFVPPAELLAATAAVAATIPDTARGPGRAFADRLPQANAPWLDLLAAVGRHP